MSFSQNLQFDGHVPVDPQFDHPSGRFLALLLERRLGASEWHVSEPEDWRDCGWVVTCRREDTEVEVVVSDIEPSTWMLQIAPAYVPGFFGRLAGEKVSADRTAIQDVARRVHDALQQVPSLSRFRWLWDGFPDDGPSTPEPAEWVETP